MSPRWLHWPAATAAEDWDTYEDGIWTVSSLGSSPDGVNTETKASVAYQSTGGAGFRGWYNSGNYPASRYWNTSGGDVIPPAVAVWNATDSVWLGWSTPTTPSSSVNASVFHNVAGSGGAYLAGSNTDEIVVIYLTQTPTDFSNWSDYA